MPDIWRVIKCTPWDKAFMSIPQGDHVFTKPLSSMFMPAVPHVLCQSFVYLISSSLSIPTELHLLSNSTQEKLAKFSDSRMGQRDSARDLRSQAAYAQGTRLGRNTKPSRRISETGRAALAHMRLQKHTGTQVVDKSTLQIA